MRYKLSSIVAPAGAALALAVGLSGSGARRHLHRHDANPYQWRDCNRILPDDAGQLCECGRQDFWRVPHHWWVGGGYEYHQLHVPNDPGECHLRAPGHGYSELDRHPRLYSRGQPRLVTRLFDRRPRAGFHSQCQRHWLGRNRHPHRVHHPGVDQLQLHEIGKSHKLDLPPNSEFLPPLRNWASTKRSPPELMPS